MFFSIALDGPSGAGKSTLARALAASLSFIYMDTGALYRTVGYLAFLNHIPPTDAPAVTAALSSARVEIRFLDGSQHAFLNDTDVSDEIRLPEMSRYASLVSAIPEVRTLLLKPQRDFAASHNVIMDGRDIGTVVLPDATVKIFLTASPEERAARRFLELRQRGTPQSYESVLADILERDARDSTRAVAPLKKAPDAITVDTTGLTFEQSYQKLYTIIQQKLAPFQ
ncbi:MAG: (d)CMP kinase [Eubacteriales bacterium]|jgi:cytidylate kinase